MLNIEDLIVLENYCFSNRRVNSSPPEQNVSKIEDNNFNGQFCYFFIEWVIKFNSLSWVADIVVHVIHINHIIITNTLEYLSSLT